MTGPIPTTEQAARMADATDEVPVYLPAGEEHVFGILTRPTVAANGTAVLFLHAGAQNLSCHRNRLWTRLSRELASLGYHSFRMDFHGSGDSSGTLVNRDVSGQTQTDVAAAVGFLLERGNSRVVPVGTCWGALVALVAAAEHDVVVRSCLVSPPLRLVETGASASQRPQKHDPFLYVLRSAMKARVAKQMFTDAKFRSWLRSRARRRIASWVPAHFEVERPTDVAPDHVQPVGSLLFAQLRRRGVPIHVLFGERDQTYLGLRESGMPPSVEAASEIIEMTVTPVTVHGLTTVAAQDTVRRYVLDVLAQDASALSRQGSAR